MAEKTVAISDIIIGDRHRKDMGDIAGLAASIEAKGLLHPVVILADKRLVAGERRIAACRHLGRTEIDVNIASDVQTAQDLLEAERDENTCRKDFTPLEAVALGAEIEKLVAPQVEKAKEDGGRHGGEKAGKGRPADRDGKSFPKPNRNEAARTTSIAASAVGMSRPTYEKAKAVVASNNQEAIKRMEETGKVDGAYKMVAPRSDKSDGKKPKNKQRYVSEGKLRRFDAILCELESLVDRPSLQISIANVKEQIKKLRDVLSTIF